MKLDWSKILFIVMTLFILFIVGVAIKLSTLDSALYEKDYYEQGEQHETRLTQLRVANNLRFDYNASTQELSLGAESGQIVLQTVKCLYMAAPDKDKIITFKGSEPFIQESFTIPLTNGFWILEVSGTYQGETFFKKLEVKL